MSFKRKIPLLTILLPLVLLTAPSYGLPEKLKGVCDGVLELSTGNTSLDDLVKAWRDRVTPATPAKHVIEMIEKVSQVRGTETIAIQTFVEYKAKGAKDSDPPLRDESFHRVRKYPAIGKEVAVRILMGGLSRSLESMHTQFDYISYYQKRGMTVLTVEPLGQGVSHAINYLREPRINNKDPLNFDEMVAPSAAKVIRKALVQFGYLERGRYSTEIPVHISGESYSGHLTARIVKEMPKLFKSWTPVVSGALNTGHVMWSRMAINYVDMLVRNYLDSMISKKNALKDLYNDDFHDKILDGIVKLFPSLPSDPIVRNGVARLTAGMLSANAFADLPDLPDKMDKNLIIAENDEVLPPIIHYWMHAANLQRSPDHSRLIVVRDSDHHMLSHPSKALIDLTIQLNLAPESLPKSEHGVYELKDGRLLPLSWDNLRKWTLERSNELLGQNSRGTLGVWRPDFITYELTDAPPSWTMIRGLHIPK